MNLLGACSVAYGDGIAARLLGKISGHISDLLSLGGLNSWYFLYLDQSFQVLFSYCHDCRIWLQIRVIGPITASTSDYVVMCHSIQRRFSSIWLLYTQCCFCRTASCGRVTACYCPKQLSVSKFYLQAFTAFKSQSHWTQFSRSRWLAEDIHHSTKLWQNCICWETRY